jgi:hypothetical protein
VDLCPVDLNQDFAIGLRHVWRCKTPSSVKFQLPRHVPSPPSPLLGPPMRLSFLAKHLSHVIAVLHRVNVHLACKMNTDPSPLPTVGTSRSPFEISEISVITTRITIITVHARDSTSWNIQSHPFIPANPQPTKNTLQMSLPHLIHHPIPIHKYQIPKISSTI